MNKQTRTVSLLACFGVFLTGYDEQGGISPQSMSECYLMDLGPLVTPHINWEMHLYYL